MLKASEKKRPNSSYNLKRFFFWFDTNWNLVKLYDRDYGMDYFVKGNDSFIVPFKEAVSKLDETEIKELKARVLEPEYKEICNQVLAENSL